MANPEHVALLWKGSSAWNRWLASTDARFLPDLRGADLAGADLSGARLVRADLSEASLRRAVLRDCALEEADLDGADLTGADLGGADLSRADLRRADCRLVDLTGATLEGADFRRADLSGARLPEAFLQALAEGADLGGAEGPGVPAVPTEPGTDVPKHGDRAGLSPMVAAALVLAAAIVLHALVPRYEAAGNGRAVDRWTGAICSETGCGP